MNGNQLSKRLQKIADYLVEPVYFADIGSDHAYLPCYVCSRNSEAFAIAGELNRGPFLSAQKEVADNQLEDRIEVKQGNGLAVIDERVNQIVIAGMGGPLIRDILEEGKNKLRKVSRIIAQPNIDARSIRRWLIEHNYNLVEECIIVENGHIYEILVAEQGEGLENYNENILEKQLWFGPHLLEEKNEAFQMKWQQEKEKKRQIIHQIQKSPFPDESKLNIFEREIRWIEEALTNG
ncbi:tRNA (adenine(22)-N(1))-methyltransferase TrmK [Halobacillus sp. A1]|uniref:tRNA (adenine(22)-N(1))-methyltransferase n=1 Tax=Halobacillus sp. A1 TaxID=2880262 RepID=UPI0020A6C889|nr:tRNA (adenine(22)-N(1))-methyltransferase TrmK [Halobacillus sp. A1]MCP3030337.1 tRNA (adenine(22)-N(1))-methyltransferase TrmK [Halobacillus sp. A1]